MSSTSGDPFQSKLEDNYNYISAVVEYLNTAAVLTVSTKQASQV